ncbi:MAG: DUF3095 domain-containing protein [Rhodothermales bacterium]
MSSFYRELPLITAFSDVFQFDQYRPAPADWWIVITDVAGSTQAIQEGRYKAVNFVGAIAIAAVQNAIGDHAIPFVFGGDGATMLIPPSEKDKVAGVLRSVQETSEEEYDLTLRVGLISVREVQEAGYEIAMGRYGTTEHFTQAVFTGGGLAYAERRIKDPKTTAQYGIQDVEPIPADYSGVECRWSTIENPLGETISLLVEAKADDPEEAAGIYREVIYQIEQIVGTPEVFKPIVPSHLRLSYDMGQLAQMEPRIRASKWVRPFYLLKIWLLQFVVLLIDKTKAKALDGARWDQYLEHLVETTDAQKFDEMLRMVLACSPGTRQQLDDYLEAQYQAGRLVYGTHSADSALLTCVVHERMGAQVHFVDGSNGGYALASKGLKARMRGEALPS